MRGQQLWWSLPQELRLGQWLSHVSKVGSRAQSLLFTRKLQQGLEPTTCQRLRVGCVLEEMTGAIGPTFLGGSDVSPAEALGGCVLPMPRIIALDKRDKVFKVRAGL